MSIVTSPDQAAISIAFRRACERHNYDPDDEDLAQFAAELTFVAYFLGRLRGGIDTLADEDEVEDVPIETNSPGGDA